MASDAASPRCRQRCVFASANTFGQAKHRYTFGRSKVINPRGIVVAEAGMAAEEVLVSTIDLDQVSAWRKEMLYLDDLNPALFKQLDEEMKAERASPVPPAPPAARGRRREMMTVFPDAANCGNWGNSVPPSKIPGSLMVGAMLTTILFNLLTGRGMLPGGASVFVQFLLGAYIGTMLHREDIKS